MSGIGSRLRERAQQLNLSDAEVARRAGLSPRRYGFYVTGDREPDYRTLATICRVLNTSPNYLLGFGGEDKASGLKEREALTERLIAATNTLGDLELQLVVEHAELVSRYRRGSPASKRKRR